MSTTASPFPPLVLEPKVSTKKKNSLNLAYVTDYTSSSFPLAMRACVHSALHSKPLFWRVANNATSIGGHDVSRGAVVVMSAAVLGRDPRQWSSDADDFVPFRFLNTDEPEADHQPHPFAFLPFGAGGKRATYGVKFSGLLFCSCFFFYYFILSALSFRCY